MLPYISFDFSEFPPYGFLQSNHINLLLARCLSYYAVLWVGGAYKFS